MVERAISHEGKGATERTFEGDHSVVVRVRNEEDNLGHLFDLLEEQTVTPQLVVVDNASTDGTVELAKARGALVVSIAEDDFSYPKASNLGVERADGELVTLMSAHSYPMRKDWLELGASHFSDPVVAGVYCRPIAHRDTTRTDRVASEIGKRYLDARGVRRETRTLPGQMGSTNSMTRRDLLLQRPFDEKFGAGGEDADWAKWATGERYVFVNDNRFTVYHSHSLGPIGWARQYKEWLGVGKPKPFDREAIEYRRRERRRGV